MIDFKKISYSQNYWQINVGDILFVPFLPRHSVVHVLIGRIIEVGRKTLGRRCRREKIGKAHYTKSQCLMEIASAAAHEAGRGCHARRSRAAVTWGARRRRGCHVRCAASCDIASRRIVTPRSGIQIALLAVSPTFFFFSAATKGGSLCNRWSEAARDDAASRANGKNVRWTSYRALGLSRVSPRLCVAREILVAADTIIWNGIELSSLEWLEPKNALASQKIALKTLHF